MGINCVYLYYKEQNILILAYGIMENFVDNEESWPDEIADNNSTINEYFENNLEVKPYRYGASFIFKTYTPVIKGDDVNFLNHLKTFVPT